MELKRCRDSIEYRCAKKIILNNILNMLKTGNSAHIGGSLSCLDILICIFQEKKEFNNISFIFSKGHCECGLYAVLMYYGFLDEEFKKFKQIESAMQGHPNKKWITHLDYSAGSLGQGISFGIGKALYYQINNIDTKVVILLGDGEIQEGQFWEAILTCVKYNLSNVIIFIDVNAFQLEGKNIMTSDCDKYYKVFTNFGLDVFMIDGHNPEKIKMILQTKQKKPILVLAKTIKGKGISFMENNNDFHGRELTEKELALFENEVKTYNG